MSAATLNVRMDTQTKEDFSRFCDEIGVSASSLVNVFAKTVVKNQTVPFPLTTLPLTSTFGSYDRIFPKNEAELEHRLSRSAATPSQECSTMTEAAERVRERLEW